MIDLHLTKHGEARMHQRGYRKADLDLLIGLATQVAADALLLTDEDACREIAKRKREIQQLERLRGSKIVIADGGIVTLYHTRSGSPLSARRRSRRDYQ
jgi:hypothetical protein